MKKIQKLLALTAMMSIFAGQVQAQAQGEYFESSPVAYDDGMDSSYTSIIFPALGLAAAAVLIATTNRHHGHGSSSSSGSHSSHSHYHSH